VSKVEHDSLKEEVKRMKEDQVYFRDLIKTGKKTKGLPKNELLEAKVKNYVRETVFPRMKFITCDEELESVKGRLLQYFKMTAESEKAMLFWSTYGGRDITATLNHVRNNAQTAAQGVCKGKIGNVHDSVKHHQGAIHFSHPDLPVGRVLFRETNATQLAEAFV
jgi:hypothetical protein